MNTDQVHLIHPLRYISLFQLELWADEERLASGTLTGSAFPARPDGLFIGGVRDQFYEKVPLIPFKGTIADVIVDAQ